MGAIKRGIRNAFRNLTRTFSIVLILSLSIGLAITMLVARSAVQQKIAAVKSSIGNTVTVSPAGIRGFEGGGELLTEDNVVTIKAIEHVVSVIETLSDRLTPSNDTSLSASLEAGSFGRRQQGNSGSNVAPTGPDGASSTSTRTFTMPITVMGINNLDSLSALNASSFTLTAGEKFDPASDASVALVGKDLAAKNNLTVGSTFTAHGTAVAVKGIFDAGNTFTNNSLVMPIKSVQKLSDQTGQISNLIVQTDSIDNLSSVKTTISDKLGSKADVVSSQDTTNSAITPLENIKSISTVSLFGSLIAGAVIILLTMMMIVRERRREIGVLKAIGANNLIVMTQFIVESITLTALGAVLGLAIGIFGSNPVINVLVQNSTNATQTAGQGRVGGGPGVRMMEFAGQGVASARNLKANVGWEVLLYGLGISLTIAVIGSAIPAYIISKVRPAEVMRAE